MSAVPSKTDIETSSPSHTVRWQGLLLGFVGVACFSLTLPTTLVAVRYFDPIFVALGRAIVAGVLSLVLLLVTRQTWPRGSEWWRLIVVSLGVVVGFPILSSYAMKSLPASQGAIVTGLIPLCTAAFGAYRAKQNMPWLFWVSALAGSSAVVIFSLASGGWNIRTEHAILLLAVIVTSISYTEGAILAKTLGSWQVICWTLVVSLPFLVAPVVWSVRANGLWIEAGTVSPQNAWLAFAYLSLVSMFLAFFAWYRGLMLGGIPQVSQIQLLQPFMTISVSAIWLGEELSFGLILTAILVVLCVVLGRWASRTPKVVWRSTSPKG